MTLKRLKELVDDAIERGEGTRTIVLDGNPLDGQAMQCAGALRFGRARYSDGMWIDAEDGEPVCWLE